MSEIVKSEYNALGEDNNYKTYYFKTSADLVEGLDKVATSGSYNDLKDKPTLVNTVNSKTGDVVVGDVKDLSITGRTITVTFADGTTKTLTTQDNVGITTNKVPNYSAGVSHSVNNTTVANFSAPSDGVVVADFVGYSKAAYMTINGNYVYNRTHTGSNMTSYTGQFIVKQGDTIKANSGYNDTSKYSRQIVTFYPYR